MMMLGQIYWLTTPMMRGDEVWIAQSHLAQRSYTVRADGIFGTQTRDAVAAFQGRAGLRVDGVVGPLTWAALQGQPIDVAAASTRTEQFLDDNWVARLKEPHRRYPESVQWSVDGEGLSVGGDLVPPSGTDLVQHLLDLYAATIASIVSVYPVPIELIIATICAESSGAADALRYEPGCDKTTPERTPGRVSMGLMQTLLSTARNVLDQPELKVSDLAQPATSIRAGMGYMWRQARRTQFDPPLVAAAYNAGNVLYNSGENNRWRLKQYPIGTGNHVNRFVGFFNAAMQAVKTARTPLPDSMPSFVRSLATPTI